MKSFFSIVLSILFHYVSTLDSINHNIRAKRLRNKKLSFAHIVLAIAIIFAGCGGGGRTSDRGGNATTPGSIIPTPPTSPSTASDCSNSKIRVSWFSPYHGSHATLDIQYAGQTQRRQIQVIGLPSGLNDVVAYPFDGIVPTANGTTFFATDISPYTGYNLSSVKLDEWTDLEGVTYYRAWIYFSPWTESLPLPSRLNLFSKITWAGGSYKACLSSERLGLGHIPCYGPDYLSLDCHPVCGDGITSVGEECDDGNEITEKCDYGETSCAVCNELCFYSEGATSYCGNNRVDADNGEICDVGLNNGLICEPSYGGSCEYCSPMCSVMTNPGPNCGDGSVQIYEGEECDEGAANNVACLPDYGSECTYCDWTCHFETVAAPRCGDGNIDLESGETCDDGNAVTEVCAYGQTSCQVCDSSCHLVAGATSYCGNGATDSTNEEECDDGNTVTETCAYGQTSCTICDATCLSVAGATSYCGDGTMQADNGETCDDGNTVTESCAYGEEECVVCNDSCQLDYSQALYCGDDITQTQWEECDAGSLNGIDCNPAYGDSCSYCSRNCEIISNPGPYCGDGVTQSKWEECDDGLLNGDVCSNPPCAYCDWNCRIQRNLTGLCGNGVLDLLEDCDDGNTISGDGCDSKCRIESKYLVGAFTVDTCDITMEMWDYGAEDEDKYILYHNGVKHTQGDYAILYNRSNPLSFNEQINLTQCHNVFTAECVSQGRSGPNTARVAIHESSQGEKDWTMHCIPVSPVDGWYWNLNDGICTAGQTVKITVDVVNNPCCQTPWPVCGDAILDITEECDDGNTMTGDGCTSTCRNEPSNQPPTASVSADVTTGDAPLAVNFTGGCTDIDGTCVSYLWDFGDGSPTSSLQNPTHEFSVDGVYIVTLTVTDNDGATAQETIEITILPSGIINNEWITIPAGDFVMGCADADGSCNANESPKHTVTLSEYKMHKYEVTNAQYKTCVTAAACTAPSNVNSQTRSPYYGNATYDNYPVIYVTYTNAKAYCSWVGGRLPTEAEWEKAARGPYPREPIYPWGDDAANCTLANYSGCTGDTDEVGSHPTGESYYGLMDLAGNVLHWVNDRHLDTYYQACDNTNCTDPSCDVSGAGGKCVDPQGPGTGTLRVMRGGSWNNGAAIMRASYRFGGDTSFSYYSVGFRCAKD
ncbi:MAG: Serine/threonine-protein kinase pkn1 [bacterium ADurb.Bin236]|nr:MAG: Serine/threonine-protein kinase pkn1 [bacterium ADurb.Bin236]